MGIEPLTRGQFLDRLADLTPTTLDGEGQQIDPDRAWAAYQANPERFHRPDQDNPTGDPIVALILADGPWWIDDDTQPE